MSDKTSGHKRQPYRYDAALAAEIEKRWQDRWDAEGTFHAANPAGGLSMGFDDVKGRAKFFVLDMFPYPSGTGLHVGHPLGYIGTDVFARYLRMTGHNVLHTFGYDAFGLPAEQYAIGTGRHPAATTRQNIDYMRRQLRRLGLGHDTRREVATTDVSFYRWTQWIFLRLFNSWFDTNAGRARPIGELEAEFKAGARPGPGGRAWSTLDPRERRAIIDDHRLAYIAEEPVNWCPGMGTVLANEEVTPEGRSDVGNHPVYRRPLKQWMLRITAYAPRLLADLELVDWPEPIKQMQRNWIGVGDDGYRLRDWLFSRQRYWGEPFPIVHDEYGPVALPEELLPVTLPEMSDFRPQPAVDNSDPIPPLARASGWGEVELDLGEGPKRYRRELNTMPQWAGSCWYYLRYLDPGNDTAFVDPEVERYWMTPNGVDLYVGGVEQAVLHLLYARFWHKVLYDLGHVSTPEPFRRLFNQGYILADAFVDERGMYVPAADVETADGRDHYRGRPVTRRAGKMGKSLKNGVSPDEMYTTYGADTLRLHEMAMGPLDADRPWRTDDVAGVHRFLQRLWRSLIDERTGELRVTEMAMDADTIRRLHQTIIAVRSDFERLRFNTPIAALIRLNTHAAKIRGGVPRQLAEALVKMLAPLAPHIAEELWRRLGHDGSIAYEPFPQGDVTLAAEARVTIPVQVNGQTRFTMDVPAGAGEQRIREILTGHAAYAGHIGDRPIERMVIIPGKIINVVTK